MAIKYIGSKRKLVRRIVAAIGALAEEGRVLDLFSGTSRVGHALKKRGHYVIANDHNAYAHVIAQCYVQANRNKVMPAVKQILAEMRDVLPEPGYFTKVFCKEARFFHPKNGARIDAMREYIAEQQLDPDVEAVALVSLMEAADRVDSTTGVQMAYLKKWAKRAHNDLELRLPELLSGSGLAMREEAKDAASAVEVDVAYLDPPYNQHSYRGNYHIWETLVRWDKPEYYGKACKRFDCKSYKSPFNSKPRIRDAMTTVLQNVRANHIVVSFNNEGYLNRPEIEEMLAPYGNVAVFGFDHDRYVGAQIGIHDLDGEKVGEVSHLKNVEYLYVVSPNRDALERAKHALAVESEPQLSLL